MRIIKDTIKDLFSGLEFEDQRHLYFIHRNGIKIKLPSVSSYVESFVPPFNEAKYLKSCAIREKITEEELKRKWQLINTTACDLGHKTHSFLENFTGIQKPNTPQEIAGLKFFKELDKNRYTILFRELRMYHKLYRFAGTVDIITWDNWNGYIQPWDYKTNGDLFKSYDMMYEPFEYLESHAFNHYQIQLSLYKILLEQTKYPVAPGKIVHLKIDETYTVYDTYDLSEDLHSLLKENKIAA